MGTETMMIRQSQILEPISVSQQVYYNIVTKIELLAHFRGFEGLSPTFSTESTVVPSSHDRHEPDAPRHFHSEGF